MSSATEDVGAFVEDESRATWASTARSGHVIAGTYRIVRPLGAGANGNVFEVEHLRLGRSFALKLLRADIAVESLAALRLGREARVAATVRNEHVVAIVDCGEDDGRPYLVMELCEGCDLRRLLRYEAPISAARAVRLLLDVARGVEAIHEAGLIHRDLKPENLFVTRRCTGEDWCKILDFGVAKASQSLVTSQGAIVGTVRYMAPEQLIDSSAVDARCDIYALGAMLYECLTGTPPHRGGSVQELMFRILNGAPTPLAELRPELSPRLTSLVMRCLEKTPNARPASMRELAQELEECLAPELAASETVNENPPPARRRSTDVRQRWPRLARGTSLLGLGTLLGFVIHAGLGARTPTAAAPERAPSPSWIRHEPRPSMAVRIRARDRTISRQRRHCRNAR